MDDVMNGKVGAEGTEGKVNSVKVVSWNAGGIDKENTVERAKEICSLLLENDPDVVLLQEVVADTFHIFRETLGAAGYQMAPEITETATYYFTLAFMKKGSFTNIEGARIPWASSGMGRDLLLITAFTQENKRRVMFLTSQFESLDTFAAERALQFALTLQLMAGFDGFACFAGDTNLLDSEVAAETRVCKVTDAWEDCGGDATHEYTWDLQLNKNKQIDEEPEQPRQRFDRMYFVSNSHSIVSAPSESASASAFELVGRERMPEPVNRFPSDHFGISSVIRF
jgi:hypothetical protein